jgi:hypothetical protein
MKTCSYCGTEYPDDATLCAIDQTPLDRPGEPPAAAEPKRTEYLLRSLSPADQKKGLVTLVKCGTLMEADMVATRLRAAGIQAFLPDECLMQFVSWNFGTFGYVRVQVSPKDYDAARNLLAGSDAAA